MTTPRFTWPILFAVVAHPVLAASKDLVFDLDEDRTLNAELRDLDDDRAGLVFSLSKPPNNGEARIEANGRLSYQPRKDWHGKDGFVFDIVDGKKRSSHKAVIEVSAVNDPPSAGPPVELAGTEDKPVKGQVTATDVDKDPLFFTVADSPPHGKLVVDRKTGTFQYQPGMNENGTVKFAIAVNDGTAQVPAAVTVVLAPVNDPPQARDADDFKGDEDHALQGKLGATDADNDPLTWSLTDGPKNGVVEIDAGKGTFVYQPKPNFHGDDVFGFSVSDGQVSSKGRVELQIINVNDPPTASANDVVGNEDTPLKGKLNAKDPDGDEVSFSLKIDPKHGEVDLDRGTGAFTYTPEPNFHGADKFSVEAGDVHLTMTMWIGVTIQPVNDAPVAVDGTVSGDEDKPATGKLKGQDIDKDTVSFSLADSPKNGTVEVSADGSFRYHPKPDFHGEDRFGFLVSDGNATAAAVEVVNVKPQNDAPKTASLEVRTNEDSGVRGIVTGSDIDKDKLTWTVGTAPHKGEAVIDERTGSFVYQPKAHENGADSFAVQVSDGSETATATIQVVIAAVNDAPVAVDHGNKGDEDQLITGKVTGTDVDKDVLAYAVIAKPKSGTVEIDAATGAYSYKPQANFNGTDGFRFEVSDGKLRSAASVKVTVAPVNDAPDVKALSLKTLEDKAVAGAVVASDIEKTQLAFAVGKGPRKGTVQVDAASGRLTFTPRENEHGDDSFTIIVSDGAAQTEGTVAVALAPVNDAPVASPYEGQGQEDGRVQGQLRGNDLDGDALRYTAVRKPRFGTVDVDGSTGAFTYTPGKNFHGADSFGFEVSDGKLRAGAEAKLTILAVNDVPEPKDLALITLEDKEGGGKVLAFDIDKDTLTFRLKSQPQKGTALVDDATGTVRYLPRADENGSDSFVVEVTDGFASADAKVIVTVAPVPDAPVFAHRAVEVAEDEIALVKLSAKDADAGDTVTFKIATPPRLGIATLETDGTTLRYVPRDDVHGEDAIGIEASDGKNRSTGTLPVRIAARNDAPFLQEVKAEMLEEGVLELPLVVHDKDGDPVTLALAGGGAPSSAPSSAPTTAAPAAGAGKAGAGTKTTSSQARPDVESKASAPSAVTLTGGVLRIAPRKDFAGNIEATVVPRDPTTSGAPLRIVIAVANVNDAPFVRDLALVGEAGKSVSGTLSASDVDAGDSLAFVVAVPPTQGTAIMDDPASGRFTYTANAAALGEDSFRIRVKDKAGASVSATVRVSFAAAPASTAKPGAAQP